MSPHAPAESWAQTQPGPSGWARRRPQPRVVCGTPSGPKDAFVQGASVFTSVGARATSQGCTHFWPGGLSSLTSLPPPAGSLHDWVFPEDLLALLYAAWCAGGLGPSPKISLPPSPGRDRVSPRRRG